MPPIKSIIYFSRIDIKNKVYCREILGLTALERMVRSLISNGLSKIYLFTDGDNNSLINCITNTANIDLINLESDGEVTSKKEIHSNDIVIILFGDKIYDPSFLKELIRRAEKSEVNLVYVKDENEPHGDSTNGKERESIGAIIIEGKQLDSVISSLKNDYNYEQMKTKLSFYQVKKDFWANLDDESSLEKYEKVMLNNLSKPGDGFISYYINRRISTRITKRLIKTRITPNQITITSFTLSIIAAFLFSFGLYLYTVIAGILAQLSSILDGCDGEIARLKLIQSPYGAFLDTIMDRYADVTITLGIFYGYVKMTNQQWVWPLILIPLTGFIMSSYARKEYQLRFGKEPPPSIALKLIRRDLRLFIILIGSIIFKPLEAIILMGTISNIMVWKMLISSKNYPS